MVLRPSSCAVCWSSLFLLGLFLFSSCSYGSSDLSIVSPPTVTATFINRVLEAHASPARGTGETFYSLGVSHNIDPVFPLAFFGHESSFGKEGVATQNRSIGNLRCIANYPCVNGYASFPTWSESIKAWYALLSGSLYVAGGLTTLTQVIHRYAPAADSNDEGPYVRSVSNSVQSWRNGQL